MKIVECKQVSLWDGGDQHNFGFYISKDIRDTSITNLYEHCMIQPKVIIIFDSLQEVQDNSDKNLRMSAWNKLNPMERVALNLTDPN